VTGTGATLGLIVCLLAGGLQAQGRSLVLESGLHLTLMTSSDSGVTPLLVGFRAAIRTTGATRVTVSGGTGLLEMGSTARGEVAAEYLLAPRAARRIGVYVGGGLAGVIGEGRGQFILAYIGIEKSPGLKSGWALEAGMGGGFRLRAAWHWRKFPPGWQAGK